MTREEAIKMLQVEIACMREFCMDEPEISEAYEMAIAAMREQENLESKLRVFESSGWISVKDRLPDLELVEVKTNDTELYPCLAVIKNECARNGKFVGKVWYDGECFMNGIGEIEVVTHWMPLPEPPEVVK